MSRDNFVSDGLYNITKKSAASAKLQDNDFSGADGSENFSDKPLASAPVMDKETRAVLTAAMARRFEEYGNTRKSLIERLNSMASALKEEKSSSEARLEKIAGVLADAEERLKKISEGTEELTEQPSIGEQSTFADKCRALDNLHIECVRLAAAYENVMRSEAKQASSDSAKTGKSSVGIDFDSLTFGQLFRMGFIFSLPVIFAVIIGAFIVAAGVVAAFNGSFHW